MSPVKRGAGNGSLREAAPVPAPSGDAHLRGYFRALDAPAPGRFPECQGVCARPWRPEGPVPAFPAPPRPPWAFSTSLLAAAFCPPSLRPESSLSEAVGLQGGRARQAPRRGARRARAPKGLPGIGEVPSGVWEGPRPPGLTPGAHGAPVAAGGGLGSAPSARVAPPLRGVCAARSALRAGARACRPPPPAPPAPRGPPGRQHSAAPPQLFRCPTGLQESVCTEKRGRASEAGRDQRLFSSPQAAGRPREVSARPGACLQGLGSEPPAQEGKAAVAELEAVTRSLKQARDRHIPLPGGAGARPPQAAWRSGPSRTVLMPHDSPGDVGAQPGPRGFPEGRESCPTARCGHRGPAQRPRPLPSGTRRPGGPSTHAGIMLGVGSRSMADGLRPLRGPQARSAGIGGRAPPACAGKGVLGSRALGPGPDEAGRKEPPRFPEAPAATAGGAEHRAVAAADGVARARPRAPQIPRPPGQP